MAAIPARGTPRGLQSICGSSGVVPSYSVAAIAFTLAIYSGLYGGSLGSMQELSLHGFSSLKSVAKSNRIEPSELLSNCSVLLARAGLFQNPFRFGCPSGSRGVVLPSTEHPTQ